MKIQLEQIKRTFANGLNKMSKANGTNKQRRFWLPTSEKFGSEGSSPSLIHSYLLLCAFLIDS